MGHSIDCFWGLTCANDTEGSLMSHQIPGRITGKEQVCNKSGNVDYCIGMVQFGTRSRPIDLDFVPDAQVGDYVLVQGGFAVTQIDEKEAKRRMGEITTSGELEGEGITLDAALDDDLELERRQKPHPKS